MIYPVFQHLDSCGSFQTDTSATVSCEHRQAGQWLTQRGIKLADKAAITLRCILQEDRRHTYIEESSIVSDEIYELILTQTDECVEVQLIYAKDRGLWHGVNALASMIEKNELPLGTIYDYPLFKKRGFIEGFYGKPWSLQGRKSMIDLMAENRMNTYYYAPKGDLYHRELWHEAYPKEQLDKLCELLSYVQSRHIDFHFCLAPGLTLPYSDEAAHDKVLKKLKQLYGVGIRNFGLLLDDIPEALQYEADQERFGEAVNAHIYFINRIYARLKELDSTISLTVCPWQYHGKGTEYYISRLGQGIHPAIHLFWTGRNICSQELESRQAVTFSIATGHAPLYWDNYPVNDAEMFMEMHLAPITGREETLYQVSEGIISNAMEYCESSKVPLMTIADYLWNPRCYDAKSSWKNAIETVFKCPYETVALFTDHFNISCLKQPNSVIMGDYLAKVSFLLLSERQGEAVSLLAEYTNQMLRCRAYVIAAPQPIFAELSRWIKKFSLCCDILQECVHVLQNGCKNKAKLAALMQTYNESAVILTDFCFREFVENLIEREV